jgi:hypothetical protein
LKIFLEIKGGTPSDDFGWQNIRGKRREEFKDPRKIVEGKNEVERHQDDGRVSPENPQ